MVWVEQVGTRSWRVRYVDGSGHKPSISGFDSADRAQQYASLMAAEQRRGVWVDPAAGLTRIRE